LKIEWAASGDRSEAQTDGGAPAELKPVGEFLLSNKPSVVRFNGQICLYPDGCVAVESTRANMSLRRVIIRQLDCAVGRPLLAKLTTARARRLLEKKDVEVRYDQLWLHRLGPYFVPDGTRFDYYDSTILAWKDQIPAFLRNAQDYWFGHYQPKPGDVILDVGAGRGEDVLAFSRETGENGRVLAIEAHPASYRILSRFCQLNRLSNTTPVHLAVMDCPGTVMIGDTDLWETNTVSRSTGNGFSVRAMTLDQLCKEHEITQIDFLKMNVEGAETSALKGMRDTIGKVRSICVCCHDFRADRGHGQQYRTRDFVWRFLADNGFEVSCRAGDSRDFVRDHLYGRRVLERALHSSDSCS
jgi:FkbM family methyltransferase